MENAQNYAGKGNLLGRPFLGPQGQVLALGPDGREVVALNASKIRTVADSVARAALIASTTELVVDGDLVQQEDNAVVYRWDATARTWIEAGFGVGRGLEGLRLGTVPSNSFAFSNNVTVGDTRTIGADVYEFVLDYNDPDLSDPDNIPVPYDGIGVDTYAKLVDVINGRGTDAGVGEGFVFTKVGTENVVANMTSAGNDGVVYVFAADAPGGNRLAGSPPDVAFDASTPHNSTEWVYDNFQDNLTATGLLGTQVKQKIVVTSDMLALAQPVAVDMRIHPELVTLNVVDGAGAKRNPWIGMEVVERDGSPNFYQVLLDFKPTAPVSPNRASRTVQVTADAVRRAMIPAPTGRNWRVLKHMLTFSATKAGGTTITARLYRVTAGGVATALSTAISIATGFAALTPTELVADTIVAPHDIASTEFLMLEIDAATGLTAPLEIDWSVHWIERAQAGDVIDLEAWGA